MPMDGRRLLEQPCRFAMPTFQVEPDQLEQATAVARVVLQQGEFMEQRIHRGATRPIAREIIEVGVHDPLRLDDGAGPVGPRVCEDGAHGVFETVHTGSSAVGARTVPNRMPIHARAQPRRRTGHGHSGKRPLMTRQRASCTQYDFVCSPKSRVLSRG